MPYLEISIALNWNVSALAIQNSLERAGFLRHVARRKPHISEKNRILRLAWARSHLNWTRIQWNTILWTDETWVTSKHRKVWVTRRGWEAFEDTCLLDKEPRPRGWMFWGCFPGGLGKGPGMFWEKDWGSISAASYQAYILPTIVSWIQQNPGYELMQDHAPGHSAKSTLKAFEKAEVPLIFSPAFSPDLNPIETVWNLMKDWIQDNYIMEDLTNYKTLRKGVIEAWESVGQAALDELLDGMHARCVAVINADGRATKY